MSDHHEAHGQQDEDGAPGAEEYKAGERFGLTPEEERRGTPLQQEVAGDVPTIAGRQDDPVPHGPVPGDPRRPDPLQPVPDPNLPDPLRPYPEPGEPDPTPPRPGEPFPPQS